MTDSWWLKVKRAQKHMVDIYHLARAYSETHPYEFIRVRLPNRHRKARYTVRITEQPDPMLAVMVGDFVHNLRSALDHIVAANVPRKERKSAYFPVSREDLWAIDDHGNFVVKDDKRRDDFERAIRGLKPRARAAVVIAQPYRGTLVDQELLGIISRLENADKHRELAVVLSGVSRVRAIAADRMGIWVDRTERGVVYPDGATIDWEVLADNPTPASEVDVQFSATATVDISVTSTGGNLPPIHIALEASLLNMLRFTRRLIRGIEVLSR